MKLEVVSLEIPEVKIIRAAKFEDPRGYFTESYNKKTFTEAGIDLDCVQDNHVLSKAVGTVRGLHYQAPPFAQDKLIRVVRGRIFDVAVDIRKGSPTYGRWVSAELSAADRSQILVPIGFAHGLCTLEPDTEVIYKVTNYYSAKHDFGIRWDDPTLGIDWPVKAGEAKLSDKDERQPLFREIESAF